MPALSTSQRVVIRGLSPQGEVWQTSFGMVGATPADQAALQSLSDQVEPYVNTFWTAVKAHVYNSFSYVGIKVYQYAGASSRAALQAQTDRTASAGTLATNGSPIDTALVLSLRTPTPGRAARGRMYIPCHDVVNPSTCCFVGTASADYAAAYKVLVDSIATNTPGAVAVLSRTTSSYNLVTRCLADNKPDVQRRREGKIVPSIISSVALP